MNEDEIPPLRISLLCSLTVAFACGIGIGRCCPCPVSLVPEVWVLRAGFILIAFFLAATVFFDKTPGRSSIRLSIMAHVVFLGLGVVACRLSAPIRPYPPCLGPFLNRNETLFLAEVIAPPDYYPDKARLQLGLREAFTKEGARSVEGGVLLTMRSMHKTWIQGDRLLARLSLDRFHSFSNPGGYDYEIAQAERGLYARAYIPDDRFLVKLAPDISEKSALSVRVFSSIADAAERFRQNALSWLRANLQPDQAAFFASLLIGYQHLLTKEWQDHLNRTGAMHLLSISGVHLGLISMTAFWTARRLVRIPAPRLLQRTSDQHIAIWAALAAASIYALISGLSLPTWRSVFMLAFAFGAFYWYRFPDPLSALAAAAMIILVISPYSLRNISFQLTFAAMAGMFVVLPRLSRFIISDRSYAATTITRIMQVLRPFEYGFWTSIAANATVLPLCLYYFHGISAAGFVANIVLVPLVGFAVLPLGLLSLAVFAVHERAAVPVLLLGNWFLERSQDLVLWFSRLSWAYFWAGDFPARQLVGFYAGLAILLGPWGIRKKAACCAVLLGVCAAMTVMPLPASILPDSFAAGKGGEPLLKATVVDVGQGSSTLVEFPTGETMLVDGGGFFDDSFDIGRYVLAPFLWASGIRRLDYVVLSHDHPDHRNGLRFILEQFDVRVLWESGISDLPPGEDTAGDRRKGAHPRASGSGSRLSAIAEKRGIPVRRVPDILGAHEVGPCRINILHPNPDFLENKWDGKDLNDISIVIEISHGDTRLIVPGDISRAVEKEIFSAYVPPGPLVLIAPHHGSIHSGGPVLFDRLQPCAVVFSCGYHNVMGMPAPAFLARCGERGIPVYRTDQHGAVRAVSNGSEWEFRTWRKPEHGT